MAEGVKLGSAFYELTVDGRQYKAELENAEQLAKLQSQKISGQLVFQARGDNGRFIASLKAAESQAAASSRKIRQELAEVGGIFDGLGTEIGRGFARSVRNIAVGALGVGAVQQALAGIIEVNQRAAQTALTLNTTFGANSAQFTAFANELADSLKRSRIEMGQTVATIGQLQRNYGLTAAQVKQLTIVTADLAAASGKDLPDAAMRVNAALRGEAESIEVLGINVQVGALKQFAAMTDAQRRNFESLTQTEQAQIRFAEIIRQSGFAIGAAAERANSAAGAQDKLAASTEKLAVSLGKVLAPGAGAAATEVARLAASISGEGGLTASALAMNEIIVPAIQLLGLGLEGLANNPGIQALIKAGEAIKLIREQLAIGAAESAGANSDRRTIQSSGEVDPEVRARVDAAADLIKANKDLNESLNFTPVPVDNIGELSRAYRNSGDAARKLEDNARLVAEALQEQGQFAQLSASQVKTLSDAYNNLDRNALAAAKINEAARERQKIFDTAKSTLAAAAPEERAELARRLEAQGAVDAAEALAELQQDKEQQARDSVRIVQDQLKAESQARKDALQEAEEILREHQQDARDAIRDDAEAERDEIRDTLNLRLEALDEVRDKERERHQEAITNLEKERDAAQEKIDLQLEAMDAEDKAKSRGKEDERASDRVKKAERRLKDLEFEAAGGVRGKNGLPVSDPGRLAEEVRAAEKERKDALAEQAAIGPGRASEDKRSELQGQKEAIDAEFEEKKKGADALAAAEDKRLEEQRKQLQKDAAEAEKAAAARADEVQRAEKEQEREAKRRGAPVGVAMAPGASGPTPVVAGPAAVQAAPGRGAGGVEINLHVDRLVASDEEQAALRSWLAETVRDGVQQGLARTAG